jgi:hypothetical protein
MEIPDPASSTNDSITGTIKGEGEWSNAYGSPDAG